jgi:hypothetical protein
MLSRWLQVRAADGARLNFNVLQDWEAVHGSERCCCVYLSSR